MSAQEIPEWFTDFILRKDLVAKDFFTTHEEHIAFAQGAWVAFKFLSKPESVAKIPEVAKLIEALKFYKEPYNFYGENIKECDLNTDPCGDLVRRFGSLAKEALKPFKGGE